MTKAARLRKAREAAGYESASDAARAIGIPAPTYIGHENGLRGFNSTSAEQYAYKFKVSLAWLLTGRGDDLESPKLEKIKNTIPIIGTVAAGMWQEIEDLLEEPKGYIPLMPGLKHPVECYFVLRVQGDSMNKMFQESSLLVCLDVAKSGVQILNDDIVIVEQRRQQEGIREISAKRAVIKNGTIELWPESTNPKYRKPLVISRADVDDSVHVIARVEGAYTQF